EVLRGWIGRDVAALTAHGEVTGRLRAVAPDHLVVAVGDELRVVERPAEVRGPAGEDGAGTQLRWTVDARAAGTRSLEAAYVMRGLAWHAGYTVVLDG